MLLTRVHYRSARCKSSQIQDVCNASKLVHDTVLQGAAISGCCICASAQTVKRQFDKSSPGFVTHITDTLTDKSLTSQSLTDQRFVRPA